jgi:hypothetical protein
MAGGRGVQGTLGYVMTETVLLVDYENVQEIDLAKVPATFDVRIFIGASQSRVPTALLTQALARGGPTKVVRVDGAASNALDFHIAFYLGEYFTERPSAKFIVLSGDKGFDPLVRHLASRKCDCRRISALSQLDGHGPASHEDKIKRVIELLSTMEKKARPRKRKTLAAHIGSYYQKKLPGPEVEALIDRLIHSRQISISGTALTYHF